MSKIHPSRALYYPHAEFGSSAWVKSALLYWESIARIVPEGAVPADDREIRELVEAKLIESIAPEPYKDRTMQLFGERLEDLLRGRESRIALSVPPPRGLRGIEPERLASNYAEIAAFLRERGFSYAADAFTALQPEMGSIYLTMLAYEIASLRHLAPVTDDPIFDAVDTFFEAQKLTDDPKVVVPVNGLLAAQLIVPTPSLEALETLPIARLLEIRRKYAVQRRSFREKVQDRASAIARLPSVEAVRDYLNDFAIDIQDDLGAAREAMKQAKARQHWSLLKVSAPASVAVGVALTEAAFPLVAPVAGVSALALAVTNWFLEQHNRPPDAEEGHYLIELESEVGADRARGLAASLRKLVKGAD